MTLLKDIIHKTGLMTVITVMALLHVTVQLSAQELYYPERWKQPLRNVLPLYHQDTVTIRFIGDVMMHSKQLEKAHRGASTYDFSTYFSHIGKDLKTADIAVANMEFALGGEPYSGYPSFSAPDALAEHMAELGIDIFLAANNHIYDRGLSGAERTLEQYRRLAAQYGTSFVGLASDEGEKEGNMPLILNIKGVKLAFLNFTYATNGGRREGWPKVCYMDERKDIRNAIETARKAKADMIIALPHWGEEYRLTHSAEQEEMAQWLTDQGVNIIIGTHPHVVQDSAVLSSRLDGAETQVIYSLGNAISNMSATNTQLELMASVRIVRHCNGDLELLPVELDFLWCSRPGGFDEGYTVLPIKEYIGRRSLWTNPSDYDNMMNSFRRVAEATGINTTDIKYINE